MPEFTPQYTPDNANLDDMGKAFLAAAEWLLDDEEKDKQVTGFAQSTINSVINDCASFKAQAKREKLALQSDEKVGHDFFLTRNRHGAGFWDRGLGKVGERLTVIAHAFGDWILYVGDDGLLYASGHENDQLDNVEPETAVIFRRLKDKYKDVIAVFPYLVQPGYNNCECYMHIGQHSAFNLGLMKTTTLANLDDADVQALIKELSGEPYNYKLKTIKRVDRQTRDKAEREYKYL